MPVVLAQPMAPSLRVWCMHLGDAELGSGRKLLQCCTHPTEFDPAQVMSSNLLHSQKPQTALVKQKNTHHPDTHLHPCSQKVETITEQQGRETPKQDSP